MYLRAAFLFALVYLVAIGDQAQGQKQQKGKQGNVFRGMILDVGPANGNAIGTITVVDDKYGDKKGGGEPAGIGGRRTFQVTGQTKLGRAAGKGKKKDKDPIRFTHLGKGMHVIVHHVGANATEI